MSKLDARQRAVLVHGVDQEAELFRVAVVPDPRLAVRRGVGGGVDRTLLGADDAPAALGLHAPVRGIAVGHVVAVGVAMRHLVEAVS